jgi:sterol desaturase/sphingolipid hydroxylase (fatty acid hydroxylase superfamily)
MTFGILSAEWQLFFAMSAFVTFWLVESVAPFFPRSGRVRHAARNLAVAVLNAVALALLLSGLTVGVAHLTETRYWGILNNVPLTPFASILLAVLALDLWTYWWHRANHRISFLWRFHRMHHSDPAMDVTTATRFHLGEIALSTVARLGIIPLVGIPLHVIVGYELILLLSTQFHHSNIALPAGIDRILRALIVSPNMHRVHHSIERVETDSNYSSVLSIWDRLFRSYQAKPDYRQIRFGVEGFSGDWSQNFVGLMLTPIGPRIESQRAVPSDR